MFIKVPLIVSIIVIVVALVFFWGWFSAELVLKLPRLEMEATPESYGLQYEDIAFTSSDGIQLKAWFVPYEKSDKTIILLHGWGANKGNLLPTTYFLHHRGHYNLLYLDYRNHGESGGKVSSLGCYEQRDLSAAVDFLKQKKADCSKHIGLLGVSLGGTIGILTAAERSEIEALVIESAFSDPNLVIARFAKLFYSIPRYPLISILMFFAQVRLGVWFNDYKARDHITHISPRPVFIIQCEQDLRIPPVEGRTLYDAARKPKEFWMVPGADHGEAYARAPIEYEKRVLGFFGKYLYENNTNH